MATKPKLVRGRFADERYMGAEPDLSKSENELDFAIAYNWYNYFYNSDDSKKFVQDYFSTADILSKEELDILSDIPPYNFSTDGWNCRILSVGGKLPQKYLDNTVKRIRAAIEIQKSKKKLKVVEKTGTPVADSKYQQTLSLIEIELDKLFKNKYKHEFDCYGFLKSNSVPISVAKDISFFYARLFNELIDALSGDVSVLEGYSNISKKQLQLYFDFVNKLINECDSFTETGKKLKQLNKKPKKVSADKVFKKFKFLEKFEELKLVSFNPTQILASESVITYNTKTRILNWAKALPNTTLSVKGSKLINMDEKESSSKKIRKPETFISEFMSSGKVRAKKLYDDLTTKPGSFNGRINTDIILMRAIK